MRARYQFARAAVLCSCVAVVAAQERDRSKVSDQYKWDLTHIYPTDDAWRQAKEQIAAEIPKLKAFKGKLATSASTLADTLELGSRLSKELSRTYVYASMMSDTDTRVSKYQGMQQEMVQLGAVLGAEAAYSRTGDPEDAAGDDRRFRRERAQAEELQAVSRRHPAPRRAHAERQRGASARELRRHGEHGIHDIRDLLRRRFSLSKRDVERREERPAR